MDDGGANNPQPELVRDGARNELTPERWQQIKQAFSLALECEPDARGALVQEACGGDESLRAEVQSLLAAAHGIGAATSEVFQAVSSPSPGQPPNEVDDPMLGRRIGAYRIEQRVGFGGMASVYRASRADEEYRKQVAIKLLRPDLDNAELLRRFRNERQTLAVLDHPNIVKLLDGGSTDEGLPYLVMDYVEGRPIDEYCDAHRLTVEQRLRLFCAVCEAVRCAHQSHVIHRDLKPNNILVTDDGTPKLLDFGIAKVLSAQDPSETAITRTATRRLTPAYASPEQVRGEPVTAATDVYSLGVVLYELLAGRRPYQLKQRTPAEIERAICEQEPESPSTAIDRVETEKLPDGTTVTKTAEEVSRTREGDPGKLRRSLRGDLDNILLKALQKDRQRRYASVVEFEQDITSHLEHRPIQARPSTMAYRASKFVRRHTTEVIAGAVVVLILLAAVAFSVWEKHQPAERARAESARAGSRSGRSALEDHPVMLAVFGKSPPPIRSLAVLPLQNLSGDASQEYFADGMTEELITELSRLSSLRVISRTSVMRYKNSNKSLPEIARELGVDGIIEGSALRSGERVRITAQLIYAPQDKNIWAQSYERDLQDVLVLQSTVASAIADAIRVQMTPGEKAQIGSFRPVNLKAHEAYLEGLYHLQQAQDVVFKKDKKKLSGDETGKAVDYFQQAIQADPNYAPPYVGVWEAWRLGSPLPFGDWVPRARPMILKALQLDNNLANAHRAMASILRGFDWDWKGAEREYRRAIQLEPNNIDAHADYALFLFDLGRVQEGMRESEVAQGLDPRNDRMADAYFITRQFDRAIELYLSETQTKPSGFYAHWRLSNIYALTGRHREAISELQATLSILEYRELAAELGRTYNSGGYERALEMYAARLQVYSRKSFIPTYYIASIHGFLGDKDQAFAWLERAYKVRDGVDDLADPVWDPLRSDPRFADLVRRVGLPAATLETPAQ